MLQNWGAEALVCAIAMLIVSVSLFAWWVFLLCNAMCTKMHVLVQAAPLILGALISIPEPYAGFNSLLPFWGLVLLGEVRCSHTGRPVNRAHYFTHSIQPRLRRRLTCPRTTTRCCIAALGKQMTTYHLKCLSNDWAIAMLLAYRWHK